MLRHRLTVKDHSQGEGDTHMFSIPEAEDVHPSSKNQGLNPSEDLDEYILQCCATVQYTSFDDARAAHLR